MDPGDTLDYSTAPAAVQVDLNQNDPAHGRGGDG